MSRIELHSAQARVFRAITAIDSLIKPVLLTTAPIKFEEYVTPERYKKAVKEFWIKEWLLENPDMSLRDVLNLPEAIDWVNSKEDLPRHVVLNSTRALGKSFLQAIIIVHMLDMLVRARNPLYQRNKNIALASPTHDQTSDIYSPLFHELNVPSYCKSGKMARKANSHELLNNVMLFMGSFESIERWRGKGLFYVCLDEASSTNTLKDDYDAVIAPAISTRWPNIGRSLITSTPLGYNSFYDMYTLEERNSSWLSYTFDYTHSPFISKKEIKLAKASMDPVTFASEYLASFEESGNTIFYPFDRSIHIRNLDWFEDYEDIHCAIDMNVGVMAFIIFAIRGNQIHVLKDYKNAYNTDEACKIIQSEFPNKKVIVYPDPTCRARKTSSPIGMTDMTILKSYGFSVRAKTVSPKIIDSVNAVNRLLLNGNHEVNLFVHPRCKELITCLERLIWKDTDAGDAIIDKTQGYDHATDCLRYAVDYLFPIVRTDSKRRQGGVATQF